MSERLVCICIPCFNNELTIADTLDSIVNQSYSKMTIKVFDNASSDNTRDIVQKFIERDDRVALYTREHTVSGEENFNTCIGAAEGDYCAIFHSDDIYEPTIIAEQVDYLSRKGQALAVSTHASLIDEHSKQTGERMVPPELLKYNEWELDRATLINLSFKYGNIITCPSVLFRTEILKNHIKGFNGKDFQSSADLDVWFRITEKGTLGYINKPLIRYRISAVSYTYNMVRARIKDHDLFLVLDNLLGNCDLPPEFCKELFRYRNFLLMKDRANTNLNRLILRRSDFQNIDISGNIKFLFESRFHVKFFVLAFITRLIIRLPRNTYLAKLVKRIRFGHV